MNRTMCEHSVDTYIQKSIRNWESNCSPAAILLWYYCVFRISGQYFNREIFLPVALRLRSCFPTLRHKPPSWLCIRTYAMHTFKHDKSDYVQITWHSDKSMLINNPNFCSYCLVVLELWSGSAMGSRITFNARPLLQDFHRLVLTSHVDSIYN